MQASREQGRTLVVVAIVATAGIAAAAAWFLAKGGPLAPAGPVRTLVPSGAAVYVELRGAAALWDSVTSSEAAADFAKSRARHELLGMPAVSELRSLLHEVTTQAKFELNDANLKKLFGREVAVGIVPRADAKAPDWVLVSKLDLAALAKDLIAGDSDFTKLHDVIDTRTGLCKFAVSRSEHRGVAVSRAAKGEAAFSFTLIGDALVVARDAALVTQSIDSYLDDGKGSIARIAAFEADVAKVPATAPIIEWYDLDRMRATRASITAGIEALGGGATTAGAVDYVLDGAADIRTIARATDVPGGNAYDMKWTWSAGAASAPQHPLAATLLPDAYHYMEFRGTAGLIAAWDRSPLARKLGAGYLGKKFDQFMEGPVSFARGLGAGALMGGLDGIDESESLDPDAAAELPEDEEAPPAAVRPEIGAFEMKALLRMTRRVVEELAGSSVALAATAPTEAANLARKKPNMVIATRISDGTRLLILAAQGAALARGEYVLERHGDAPFVASDNEGETRTSAACVAGHLITSNSAELLRRTIDSIQSGATPAATPRTAALATLDAGAHFVCYLRIADMVASFNDPLLSNPAFGLIPAELTMSAQVEGDFDAVRFRYRAVHGKTAVNFAVPGRATPACHGVLPADPFMHSTQSMDVAAVWRQIQKLVPDGESTFADVSAAFEEAAGVDLGSGLLPAIGPEFAMSVYRSRPVVATPGGPAQPPIPGLILAIEMEQPDVVRKAVDGLLTTAQRAIDEQAEENGGSSSQIFARERIGATDVISLSMPGAELPVTPALAFHGRFLLIASDEALIERCIAAGQPGGAALGGSRALAEATRSLPRGSSVAFLDWNGMLDQCAEYAPMLGQVLPVDDSETDDGDPVPEPPEYPDNPRDRKAMEAWQKEMQAYQEVVAARSTDRVRSWIEAARVIDVIGSTGGTADGADHADLVIRFAK